MHLHFPFSNDCHHKPRHNTAGIKGALSDGERSNLTKRAKSKLTEVDLALKMHNVRFRSSVWLFGFALQP
jgi:hypothetical protein